MDVIYNNTLMRPEQYKSLEAQRQTMKELVKILPEILYNPIIETFDLEEELYKIATQPDEDLPIEDTLLRIGKIMKYARNRKNLEQVVETFKNNKIKSYELLKTITEMFSYSTTITIK